MPVILTSKIFAVCISPLVFIFQDPTNPLSREEQKKWREQGHRNVLTKNTIEAMGWTYVSYNKILSYQ